MTLTITGFLSCRRKALQDLLFFERDGFDAFLSATVEKKMSKSAGYAVNKLLAPDGSLPDSMAYVEETFDMK